MTKPKEENSSKLTLIRQLGLFDSTMVMMGIVIGSGIFLTTGIMAKSIPSSGLLLLAWLVGGLLTLAGALTFAELGTMIPEAGGQYVYLREAYGRMIAFLFGWIVLTVYMTGGIAALAAAFTEYFSAFFPVFSPHHPLLSLGFYSLSTGQLLSVGIILLFSLVNIVGVSYGKTVQNLLTTIKILAILIFIGAGLTFGEKSSFSLSFSPVSPEYPFTRLLSGFGVALIAVFWAFDGWNNINFVTGEIKNPGRNLPLALFLGTISVTILYLLVNVVYLYALPVAEIKGVVNIAEKSSRVLFGKTATRLILVAILISILGSLNGSILTGPRVYYAMARDGVFFKRVALVHRKFHTPAFAIAIQGGWSALLALSGTFEQLFTMVIFTSWLFWIVVTATIFPLRKKYTTTLPSYHARGYPWTPILFMTAGAGILLNTLVEKPIESITGIALTLIGIPVFLIFQKRLHAPPL